VLAPWDKPQKLKRSSRLPSYPQRRLAELRKAALNDRARRESLTLAGMQGFELDLPDDVADEGAPLLGGNIRRNSHSG
jgi:hypothetical protein